MRSEQSSPLYTPSSPLSPCLKPAMAPLSPRSTARRSSKNTNSLRLANLGRISQTAQPNTSLISEEMSKQAVQKSASKHHHSHSRQHSEAQMALHNFQRELIASATRSSRTVSTTVSYKPLSPRLLPLGSPGPVTPLLLEEEGGYLGAGAFGRGNGLDERGEREFVDRLKQEQDRRQSPQV